MFRTKIPYLLAFLSCFASLALAETPQLSVDPDSLFFRQTGTQVPAALTVAVKAKGGVLGAFTPCRCSTRQRGRYAQRLRQDDGPSHG